MGRFRCSGGIMVFLGALFWSLNSPLVKFLTLNAMLICGLRSVIAAVALLPTIRPKQLRWNGWMLMYVCSYTGLCVSVILALSLTSAPVAVGMQYTATIWLFLLGLVQKKPFTLRAFFPVLVISLGVVCFMCSGTDGASQAGNLIALAEGVFFACLTVSSKRAAGTNPLGLTALANAFTGMLVFLLFPSALSGLAEMTAVEWAMMLVLGVIQVGLGYGCYNIGVQQVSAQKASVIALWEMILGPFWVRSRRPSRPKRMVMIRRSLGDRRDMAWRSSCRSTSASMGFITKSPSVPSTSDSSSSFPSQSVFSGSSKDSSVFWLAVLRRCIKISFSMHRLA